MLLTRLSTAESRLAVFGLAKNTGKTETLGAALRELYDVGRKIGVTSIGRDGEAFDIIDHKITKPRIQLAAGSLVATTDMLLLSSGLKYESLVYTGCRTPLGKVVIGCIQEAGAVEVAGPSGAEDISIVCGEMLRHGAEHVLIDGALDRRAASSPTVADSVIISTGAVLHTEIDVVVRQTRDAVELFRLPPLGDCRVREIVSSLTSSVLLSVDHDVIPIDHTITLGHNGASLATLLKRHRYSRYLFLYGSLCESFAEGMVSLLEGREFILVVRDSTRIFLHNRTIAWCRRQGLRVEVLNPGKLQAITVNPIAPRSHRFDSKRLCNLLAAAIPDVFIVDVRDPCHGVMQMEV